MQENSAQALTKTTESLYNYDKAILWLDTQGKKTFGADEFEILPQDLSVIRKLLCYFFKDQVTADLYKINLKKGIMLSGPIGSGKTSLMSLMRLLGNNQNYYIIRPCRDISFEFIKDGYPIIQKYSHLSFKNHEPVTYCFDDLGTENSLKFYGNECNIMAEIILSRHDLFVSRKLLTHITTNLSATEIEQYYGNRVRSRMRELFNLIAFDKDSKDKRK